MIREFFVPRFALIFFVLFGFLWVLFWIWFKGTPIEHRRWLIGARVPLVAALVAATCTIAVAVIVNYVK